MDKFDNLYVLSNSPRSLNRVVPIFNIYKPVIETAEIKSDQIYITANPWDHNSEHQRIFQEQNFLHFEKPYLYNKVANSFRLTYGKLQESKIFDRDDKRIKNFNIRIEPWKKTGDYILIVAPDEFPVRYYTEFQNEFDWIINVKRELRKHTDRKIFYRFKENRKHRIFDPLELYLKDAWAIVTHQSIACLESICSGVPVFNLAPSCCDSMALQNLSKIETPYYPENRWEWIKSLSYSQFNLEEISNGFAISIIKEHYLD